MRVLFGKLLDEFRLDHREVISLAGRLAALPPQ
jgi:hypothetical protein